MSAIKLSNAVKSFTPINVFNVQIYNVLSITFFGFVLTDDRVIAVVFSSTSNRGVLTAGALGGSDTWLRL